MNFFHLLEDIADDEDSLAEPSNLDFAQSPTNVRHSTGGRRHHRPRAYHRQHWVNENDLTRVNGKGIIGYNRGGDKMTNDDGFHVAGE